MILLLCAALTVIIETPLMYLMGMRKRDEILLVVCVNLVTNLLLNLSLSFVFAGREPGAVIYVLEGLVVAVEYALFAAATGGTWKLLLATLAANCVSYSIGLLIF